MGLNSPWLHPLIYLETSVWLHPLYTWNPVACKTTHMPLNSASLPSALVLVSVAAPPGEDLSGVLQWEEPISEDRFSRIGENSPDDCECTESPSVLLFCKGDPPLFLLFLAISAKEVTRGGGGGPGVEPSLRRTGQLSIRSREPRRGCGVLSRFRS